MLIFLPENQEDTAIEHVPAAWANTRGLDGIIVVGASNSDGIPQWFSQRGDVVSVYAPGFNITCASNDQNNIIRGSGTSMGMTSLLSNLVSSNRS